MHLYELAMELGERSADLAEAAPSLGLEGIGPTSDLTPEQVAGFRARYAKAPVAAGPAGSSGGSSYQMPATWGPPGGGGPLLPPPSPPSGGSGMRLGQMVMIAAAIVAVLGLFAFMIKNGGADEQRLQKIAATPPEDTDLGPKLTPKEQAFADALAEQEKARKARTEPRDLARFCDAGTSWHDFSVALANNFRRGDFADAQKLINNGYDIVNADLAEVEATIGLDYVPLAQEAHRTEMQGLDIFRTGTIEDFRARLPELQALVANPASTDLAMQV